MSNQTEETVNLFFASVPKEPEARDYQMLLRGELSEDDLLEILGDWLSAIGAEKPRLREVATAVLERYRSDYVHKKGSRREPIAIDRPRPRSNRS